MGRIELALDLFLTEDEGYADRLAKELCELNRQRQSVESQIYDQAVSMLPDGKPPEAIVLADDSWHQGVVGIVASRMAEEYCCPTFLICLDREHGKASSRASGGFNLFTALSVLSDLLESYGGHELAAGFTISRENIPQFRRQMCQIASAYYPSGAPRTVLEADCVIPPELLTVHNIEALTVLEPCGNGCPKPVFVMERLYVDRISMVGGGRHMRLRFRSAHHTINGIFFSTDAKAASIAAGDLVDVAFNAQINEYRGERSGPDECAGHPPLLLCRMLPGAVWLRISALRRSCGGPHGAGARTARLWAMCGGIWHPAARPFRKTPCACAARLSAGLAIP